MAVKNAIFGVLIIMNNDTKVIIIFLIRGLGGCSKIYYVKRHQLIQLLFECS